MIQNLAHQLSAAAGDQTVVLFPKIIFGQLSAAFLGSAADADAFPGKAVGAKIERIAEGGKLLLGVFKGFFIRGNAAAKGRGDKADRSFCRKIAGIFHDGSFLCVL